MKKIHLFLRPLIRFLTNLLMKPLKIKKLLACPAVFILTLLSCNSGPQPIRLGQDACSFCKMSIADKRFGAEMITKKGKVYKFDDLHCVLGFIKAGSVPSSDVSATWLVNFEEPHNFIAARKALLVKSADLHSPMGGNVAAFDNEIKMNETLKTVHGSRTNWDALSEK
jgi:copper chaperone NosL